jgi:hypothetical protein
MSDGSDRQEIQVTTYNVKVTDNGKTLEMEFDHDPLESEIIVNISAGSYKDITTVEERIEQLKNDNLALKEDNLILMDALATTFEEILILQGQVSTLQGGTI